VDIVRLRDDVQCAMMSADVQQAFFFRVPVVKYLMGSQIFSTNVTLPGLLSRQEGFNTLRL